MGCRRFAGRAAVALMFGSLLAACGGGGGNGGGFTPPPPPTGNITVSGRVTFDRPSYRTNNTLNFASLQRLPVRGATVEVLRASDSAVLATTTTNANGDYSAVFVSAPFIVRAKAQLVRAGAGGYDFEVRDNTSGNALYALDGATVTPSSNSVTVNLNAATGWGSTGYTGARAAAPFSILDMLYRAKELLLSAEPGLTLPAVDVYWSTLNLAEVPPACDTLGNPVTGQIGTTFYLDFSAPADASCPAVPAGIYVLGDASGDAGDDADEFDVSVIAHEFSHFYEDHLSRKDSMGGPHSLDNKLDLTVAFSEGFGNAFQGFVLNDPVYRDTFGTSGNDAFYFSIENDHAPYAPVEGYFSEASVAEFLWDVFDGVGEAGDQINLGFAPIHTVMRNDMRTTEALTSIYVMAAGLELDNPAQQVAIRQRLSAEGIIGTGEFGMGEGRVDGDITPFPGVYTLAPLGSPIGVTSINRFADADDTLFQSYNRHGGRRYLRIVLQSAGNLHITAQESAGRDPDFVLYQGGVNQCPTLGGACYGEDDSSGTGLEEATYTGLPAGTYVLGVADCSNLGTLCRDSPAPGDYPITVTVTPQ